ncbi:hypothetical protein ACFVU3_03760 [Streptomyces sp. NPDC058052]|uniref:hypothetical protein n=1 Tax=Streptomyces sp. NPDC058052 TaxID=3346316 RepID=UPI0036EE4C2A
MDHVIDLDEAAAVLARRSTGRRAAGLAVGRVTWRDATARWPQPLETDRALVHEPDSVGVRVLGPDGAELSVVLFRGGWADVDFLAGLDGGALPASGIASAEDFASRTDGWITRVFGGLGGVEQRSGGLPYGPTPYGTAPYGTAPSGRAARRAVSPSPCPCLPRHHPGSTPRAAR